MMMLSRAIQLWFWLIVQNVRRVIKHGRNLILNLCCLSTHPDKKTEGEGVFTLFQILVDRRNAYSKEECLLEDLQ